MSTVWIALVTIALCVGSISGNRYRLVSSPVFPPSTTDAGEFLKIHNDARAKVGVPSLHWSQNLTSQALSLVRYQRDKKKCGFANLNSGKFGANQSWFSGLAVTPSVVVSSWVDEGKYYNHSNNSCQVGHQCGVYTQVVWKNSQELGCAQAKCNDGGAANTLTICLYFPPGNVVGESPY